MLNLTFNPDISCYRSFGHFQASEYGLTSGYRGLDAAGAARVEAGFCKTRLSVSKVSYLTFLSFGGSPVAQFSIWSLPGEWVRTWPVAFTVDSWMLQFAARVWGCISGPSHVETYNNFTFNRENMVPAQPPYRRNHFQAMWNAICGTVHISYMVKTWISLRCSIRFDRRLLYQIVPTHVILTFQP